MILRGLFGSKQHDITPLRPKESHGPADFSLREFPLLYLYFDYFQEIDAAEKDQLILVAVYDKVYPLGEVLKNEELFLDLYRHDLLRVKIGDTREIFRSVEKEYWEQARAPDKSEAAATHIPDGPIRRDEYLRLQREEIAPVVAAIRKRYAL